MSYKESRAILCLGSNVADGHDNIREAMLALVRDGWSPVECSDIYPSSSGYLNQVVIATIACDYASSLMSIKSVERALGRMPEHKKQGIVPIDIDIVMWEGEVMREIDYESEYFKQGMRQMQNIR